MEYYEPVYCRTHVVVDITTNRKIYRGTLNQALDYLTRHNLTVSHTTVASLVLLYI